MVLTRDINEKGESLASMSLEEGLSRIRSGSVWVLYKFHSTLSQHKLRQAESFSPG